MRIVRYFSFLVLMVLAGPLVAQDRSVATLHQKLESATGSDRIRILLDLCWEYRFNNADTARHFGLQALQLSRDAKNEDLEAEALNYVGVTHEAQGDYTEALTYEMQALTLRRKLGVDAKTAQTLNDIGIIHDERGDYATALNYYFEARRIFEKVGDRSKIAMVLNNIGIVLKAQKEYQKVLGYYLEARSIYRSLKNDFGIAACDANLGSVHFYLEHYDSALYYALQATHEFESQKVDQFLGATVCNAGMAYDKLGNRAAARQWLLRAQQLYEKYDNKRELSFALAYLAGVDQREGRLSDGLMHARRALAIAENIDAQEQVMQAQQVIAAILEQQGNATGALKAYQQYSAAKDSLFQHEKSRQIAELQTLYETEKKEGQIRNLQQDNELKDARLDQGRQFIIGLVLILLGLVFIGYLWRNRIKLKQRAELESTRAALREQQLQAVIGSQEEERKRFAADLHDGLGQMISAVRLNLSAEQPDPVAVRQALLALNDMNGEIRNIAFNLMPQVLMKSGLADALLEFAKRINLSGRIQVSVQSFDLDPGLPTETKIALYRVCQEWVNNVIKYSGCTRISVQLVQHENELVITVEDDGQGFDTGLLREGQGNGWKNIQSRLTMIRGEIEIDSQPGRRGTTTVIVVPTK